MYNWMNMQESDGSETIDTRMLDFYFGTLVITRTRKNNKVSNWKVYCKQLNFESYIKKCKPNIAKAKAISLLKEKTESILEEMNH